MNNVERWLPVAGYEGYYEVSDRGRVRSLDRIVLNGRGGTKRLIGRVLSPGVREDGSLLVVLSRGGYTKPVRVGRLVLKTFVGPCPEYMETCHAIGSDRADCRLDVLRWDTHAGNTEDRDGKQRLTIGDIIEIRERRVGGERVAILAKAFDRGKATISRICCGLVYAHIGGPRSSGRGGSFSLA